MDTNRARKLVKDSLACIARASGKRRQRLVRQHLRGLPARVHAASRVLGSGADPEAIEALATTIDPFKRQAGTVRYRLILKPKGGHRTVCLLPNRHKAASLMVKDVLEAQLIPPEYAYQVRGRGRDREAKAIADAIENGLKWCFVGDVRSCFDSVNPEALYRLPIPRSVVQHVLDTREIRFSRIHERTEVQASSGTSLTSHASIDRGSPHGLMQGSPASNIVLTWLLSDLARVPLGGCRIFLLADDLLIAARTKDECRRTEETLTPLLRGHRAGCLVLEGEIFDASLGFERAGYHYRLGALTGNVEIDLSHQNWEKLYSIVRNAIDVARQAATPTRKQMLRLVPIVKAKRMLGGFRASTELEFSTQMIREHIQGALR